ncbi:unnamed protein product [Didymodactylos carnosus]|uniref:NAD(P)(+)--arginine ADP-ribosyltransferase n=1 Tax=Didymodactylos carnosus TaxID=1234261 RepID=A0A815L4B9_9BILA|nr:unnamed protein product [Didymodactylos carnosus]CAF1404985.1 unnamed protein product [Didymodactylos carnosus]CAF4003034.1 unnamed protein product [Didymodactylos carnosus]CAF4296858.1 unnamed protein product [Didymodactylos carnosus]
MAQGIIIDPDYMIVFYDFHRMYAQYDKLFANHYISFHQQNEYLQFVFHHNQLDKTVPFLPGNIAEDITTDKLYTTTISISRILAHIMSRFADIDLSNKKLSPIDGYWSYPLVPLEKALEPILSRIDQLDRSIKAAKKHCHYPSEHDLTRDESAALYLYTMEGGDNSFYRVLNQALRLEDRRLVKPWFSYLKLFDTALSKLPTERRNIWRGVPSDITKNFKKNQELHWWAVSSCSLSMDVIKDFLSRDTISTLFLIQAVNGKNITGYTNYPNENEVLLGPGTHLRVESIALDHAGALHVVHLAEVNDDSDTQLPSAMAAVYITPKSSNEGASGEYKIHFLTRQQVRDDLKLELPIE